MDERIVVGAVQDPGSAATSREEVQVRIGAEDAGESDSIAGVLVWVFAKPPEVPRQGCFPLADHARMREEPSSMSRERALDGTCQGGAARWVGLKEADRCR